MNVTITNLDETEVHDLVKWLRKHTINPYSVVTISDAR